MIQNLEHLAPPVPGIRKAAILMIILGDQTSRSEEHTSELQSQSNIVCRLLLEKKKQSLLIRSSKLQSHRNRAPAIPRPLLTTDISLTLGSLRTAHLNISLPSSGVHTATYPSAG